MATWKLNQYLAIKMRLIKHRFKLSSVSQSPYTPYSPSRHTNYLICAS